MPSVRKRLETLERSQSVKGGTSKDQIVRRVLERVSDAELDLGAPPTPWRKAAS